MIYLRNPKNGEAIEDALEGMYPSVLRVYTQDAEFGASTNTAFGYVLDGEVKLSSPHFPSWLPLSSGSYFSLTGSVAAKLGENSTLVTITRLGYRGTPVVGRRERKGRLSYIDGCSDKMLVYPERMGDAVLNHLHFPAGILQSQHTHPSVRTRYSAAVIPRRGPSAPW